MSIWTVNGRAAPSSFCRRGRRAPFVRCDRPIPRHARNRTHRPIVEKERGRHLGLERGPKNLALSPRLRRSRRRQSRWTDVMSVIRPGSSASAPPDISASGSRPCSGKLADLLRLSSPEASRINSSASAHSSFGTIGPPDLLLVLLCHIRSFRVGLIVRAQHGHRDRRRTIAVANLRRMVAIEFGM